MKLYLTFVFSFFNSLLFLFFRFDAIKFFIDVLKLWINWRKTVNFKIHFEFVLDYIKFLFVQSFSQETNQTLKPVVFQLNLLKYEQWKLVKSDVPLVWGHVDFDASFFFCRCAMLELLLILLSLSGSKCDVVAVKFHHFFHITFTFLRALLFKFTFICSFAVFSFQLRMMTCLFLDCENRVSCWSFHVVTCG